ncbi:MAG: 30S ribosome-binding factor RbfA [Gammaproteobacteria bacterium]|nr:30S ribosome-binding factor RbfA [Gammaproteobacteria bacterium]
MPREFSRGQRIADLIQKELAVIVQKEMKDPRIGMLTINEVTVSRDLAFADVYYTLLSDTDHAAADELLENASGFFRSQLSRVLDTRITPRLRFHYDVSVENGRRLSSAIEQALAEDHRRQQK